VDFDPPGDNAASPPILHQAESAGQLREQAAACHRLAVKARTRAGKAGLHSLGDHFDEQARKLDLSSLGR
jgi:hypothetical protein